MAKKLSKTEQIYKQIKETIELVEKLPVGGRYKLADYTWSSHYELTLVANALNEILKARLEILSQTRIASGIHSVFHEPRFTTTTRGLINHIRSNQKPRALK